jgi:hypothetical protein
MPPNGRKLPNGGFILFFQVDKDDCKKLINDSKVVNLKGI